MIRRDLLKILGLSPLVPVATLIPKIAEATPLPTRPVVPKAQGLVVTDGYYDLDSDGTAEHCVVISWDPVPGATRYDIWAVRNGNVIAQGVTRGTKYRMRASKDQTTFRVRAIDPTGIVLTHSSWS